jgi:hypothetical protein
MKRFILFGMLLLAAAACSFSLNSGPTGDTANQATSAQSFLPDIAGYTRTDADSLTNAITAATGGASLLSGNVALAAGIAKIDDMMQCYQDVGAVAAQVYTEADLGAVLQGQIPSVGALAVINEDRLERNFLNCALSQNRGLSAQAASIEPCFGSGSVTVNEEKIDYLYAATTPGLCSSFQNHFDSLGG